MLPQQVVKVLLKLVQAIATGEDVSGYEKCDSFDLIAPLKAILAGNKERLPVNSFQDIFDLGALLQAFQHRAARLLAECAQQLKQKALEGKSEQDAWNECLILMARISRAYSQYLLLCNFAQGIEDSKGELGIAEVAVLTDLARLFGLYWIEREIGDFFEDSYLSQEQAKWVRAGVMSLLDAIRPNAVALVDAFDYSDFILKSALGRFDGNVYPAIMESSKRDPLNKNDVGPGYEEHLKKLIVGGVGVYTGTASRL